MRFQPGLLRSLLILTGRTPRCPYHTYICRFQAAATTLWLSTQRMSSIARTLVTPKDVAGHDCYNAWAWRTA